MIEVIAVITTLICVYLTMVSNIWCWPIGIVSCIAYLYVFTQQQLYGQVVLQVIYMVQSFFGWYYWKVNKNTGSRTIRHETVVGHLMLLVIFTVIGSDVLAAVSNNPEPAADIFTTLLSLLGTWYLSVKIRLGWLIFVLADIVYVVLFTTHGLYFSAILYFILTLLASRGFLLWKRNSNMV